MQSGNVSRLNLREQVVRLSFQLEKRKSANAGFRRFGLRAAGVGEVKRRKLCVAAMLMPMGACVIAAGLSGCGVTQPGLGSANNTGTLVVSTQAVNFGSVLIGQTASATISVSNPGSTAVQIEQIQLQGTAFGVTGQNSAPISIGAGQNYSLGVSFQPTSSGATTGALLLTSSVSSNSQVTVALSGTGESTATATAAGLSGLTCARGAITGSGTDTCTVTLTAAAGTGGLAVKLSSNNTAAKVPASVTVAAGTTSATFNATMSAVTKAEIATLTATAGSVTKSYAIQMKTPTAAAAALDGLTCASGTITGSGSDTCSITLTTAAGTGGLAVNLSSNSTAAKVPASVTVAEAATSATFKATISAVTKAETADLTAAAGSVTKSYAIQLKTAEPAALEGLTCASGTITGSGSDTCTVTLTAAAGTGGLALKLSSNNTAAKVPASVTVAAGATSATFKATVSAVTKAETATLTATAGSMAKSYGIQLDVPTPGLTLQSTSVSFGDVNLSSPVTQTVLLTSTGTAALTISVASVTGTGFSLPDASFPLTLQPGQKANLDIQFDPTVKGADTGTVTLSTNTSTKTATISLSGTGDTSTSYEVDLSWDAPSDSSASVKGYDIYRAVKGSSSYQMLNSGVDDATNYADTTVQSGTSYTYYIVSVGTSGDQSAPSNLYNVTIP